MLHIDQDDAVPWYQAIEYFLALRRLGKEVYLFIYNGEFHGLRKKINQQDDSPQMKQCRRRRHGGERSVKFWRSP
jgi:hypothetical protein